MTTETNDQRMNGVLDRLELILVRENEGIGRDPKFDVKASNALKSRCLYDLTQLSRTIAASDLSPAAARRLADIRPLVKANETKLLAHVEAVRAVASLLRDTAQEAEADGTYSVEQFWSCEAS